MVDHLPSWFDMQIHAGDALVTVMVGLLGWGLRKSYQAVREFLTWAKGNREQLDVTSHMVDRHTLALRRANLLQSPAPRVAGRRHSDAVIDILEDEPNGHAVT